MATERSGALAAWKRRALRDMRASRRETLTFIRRLPREAIMEPRTQDRWSVKDVLGHLMACDEETVRRFRHIAAGHPEWPVFRVGVNTGEAMAGVVGERGHRIHGVFGDTVNLGARLEGQAPPGGVLIGAGTFEQLPAGVVADRVADLRVKGKAEPVVAYVLHDLP